MTFFNAEIRPNASLSASGMRMVLIVFAVMAAGIGLMFFLISGLWVAPLLLALATAGLATAFLAYRARTADRERVRVTAAEVVVSRRRARIEEEVWRSQTYFTRMELAEPNEDTARVFLHQSRRSLEVAAALGCQERRDFARALDRALSRARRG